VRISIDTIAISKISTPNRDNNVTSLIIQWQMCNISKQRKSISTPWYDIPSEVQFDTVYTGWSGKRTFQKGIGNTRVWLDDNNNRMLPSPVVISLISRLPTNDEVILLDSGKCVNGRMFANFEVTQPGNYLVQIDYNSTFELTDDSVDIWRGKMISNKFGITIK
jgi:hypothetical protein